MKDHSDPKQVCDDNFLIGLATECVKAYFWSPEAYLPRCLGVAFVYYSGVKANPMSTGFFNEAQKAFKEETPEDGKPCCKWECQPEEECLVEERINKNLKNVDFGMVYPNLIEGKENLNVENVTISRESDLIFKAGREIRLKPDFKANEGSKFKAYIAPELLSQ